MLLPGYSGYNRSMINKEEIKTVIKNLNLDGKCISIHGSFKSFNGQIKNPKTIIKAFLESGCTLLSPTFSYNYLLNPDNDNRPEHNDWDYSKTDPVLEKNINNIFTTKSRDIDRNMGIIPKIILDNSKSVRGYHPLDSLTALGPKAKEIASTQKPMDIFAPFRKLTELKGYILLMGVDLNRMTFLHYCEKEAGRNTFIRWANDENGNTIPVEIGECSEGFFNLAPYLENITRTLEVGTSKWKILPAKETLEIVTQLIKNNPEITKCSSTECQACIDAINGGPLY